MCLYGGYHSTFAEGLIWFGVKVFLLIWIVFVPIVITSRLEKIIKLLQDRK